MKDDAFYQLDKILKKQKKLITKAKNPIEKAEIYGSWAGFLDGLRLTGVINKEDYNQFYNEMIDFKNKNLTILKETI